MSQKQVLPRPEPEQDADDLLMEIHAGYQRIQFTEEVAELMCEKALQLLLLVPPQTLLQNRRLSLNSSLLQSENGLLDSYIRAYNNYLFEKSDHIFSDKKTVPEKIRNILKEMAYYGTEAVSKAYTLFT